MGFLIVKEMGGEAGVARWGARRAGAVAAGGGYPACGRGEGDRGVDAAVAGAAGWGSVEGFVGAMGGDGEGDRPMGLEAIASKTPAPIISGLDQAPSTSQG